jgi:hypothetical protein
MSGPEILTGQFVHANLSPVNITIFNVALSKGILGQDSATAESHFPDARWL